MILVTGGAGFIGSHLVEALLRKGDEVLCLDNFDDFYDPRIKERNIEPFHKKKNFILKRGDIRDERCLEEIFDKFPVKKVVHLAARPGVRPSLANPLLYADVNINGTLKLLKISGEKKIKLFILGSSSSVYGLNANLPFSENDRLERPISPYSVSKIASEYYSRFFSTTCHIPVVIFRFFTVYGPRQRPEMAIHRFTELIEKGEEIPLFGEGKTERDYTYVSDIVNGILAGMEKKIDFEIFNLGDSRTVKLSYLISLLEAEIGRKARIKILAEEACDMPVTYADITKAKEQLSYKPAVPVEEGIKRFVEWYRNKN